MSSHSLKLNPTKTVFLPISRHASFSSFQPLYLSDNCLLPSVENTRNLGVYFDSSFNFGKQISEARKLAMFHLKRLNDIRDCIPKDLFASLMHALSPVGSIIVVLFSMGCQLIP